jgi:hypothetical protein
VEVTRNYENICLAGHLVVMRIETVLALAIGVSVIAAEAAVSWAWTLSPTITAYRMD